MIRLKNVKTLAGGIENFNIPSSKDYQLDGGNKLVLIPGVIDPHISFGPIETNHWNLAIHSAIQGGVTTAVVIPDETISLHTKKHLKEKNKKVEKAILDLGISFNHLDYLIYSKENLPEIDHLCTEKELIKAILIRLEKPVNETLDLKWDNLFRLAAQEDIPLVINSNHENSEKNEKGKSLLEEAIALTEKWSNRLYVLNVSSKNEIDLIQKARRNSLLIYAETTAEHLFFEDLTQSDLLFSSINQEIIETIGSGFTTKIDNERYLELDGKKFSFSDPTFLLPLLLNAAYQKKLTLEKLVSLTSLNIQNIFEINKNFDFVLVDLEKETPLRKHINGKIEEVTLRGWPVYTIVKGHLFSSSKNGYQIV